MQQLLKKLQGDRVIWMVVIFLSLISLLSVYSSVSTAAYRDGSNSFAFMLKHLALLGMGIGVIFGVHKIQFKYLGPLSQVMFWLAVGMLVFTLFFGVELNGARRWLRIPFINMTFQTSDFAKVVLIVYTARMLNAKRTILHDFREGVLPILWPIGLVCGLIQKLIWELIRLLIQFNSHTQGLVQGLHTCDCIITVNVSSYVIKHRSRINMD